MATLPLWVFGKHVTNVSMTPQSVSSTGLLSDGTALPCAGKLRSIRQASNPRQREVSPMDGDQDHMVNVKENNSIVIQELLSYAVGVTNVIDAVVYNTSTDVFKFIFRRAGRTATFYGRRGAASETVDEGEDVMELTLTMVAPGVPNPAAS